MWQAGCRSIRLSNRLTRLDFCVATSDAATVLCRCFGTSLHHHRPPRQRGLADQEHQRDDHQE
jgi:hypothetical protein